MGRPPKLSGYLMVSHLLEAEVELGAVEKRLTEPMAQAPGDPLAWVQAVGQALIMLRHAKTAVANAIEIARDNGEIDQLVDVEAAVENALARIRDAKEASR